MLKQILNGRVLTPQGWLEGGSVIIDGNKILAVSNSDLHIVDAEIIAARVTTAHTITASTTMMISFITFIASLLFCRITSCIAGVSL